MEESKIVVVQLSQLSGQSTGCTSQVSWVRFLVTTGPFTFLYFS